MCTLSLSICLHLKRVRNIVSLITLTIVYLNSNASLAKEIELFMMDLLNQHLVATINTQSNVPKKEEGGETLKLENCSNQNELVCLHCKNCDFITFSQESLASHNCWFSEKIWKCVGCTNSFTSKDSLKVHLQIDHRVNEEELSKFLQSEKPREKIHIVDNQLLKKPDLPDSPHKPKSKIFIKDVTLLRKPDLPNDINLPNIFDSLDLTTDEDNIFDDFLGADEQIFDEDFDFDEPTVEPLTDDEIIATSEILNSQPSGKIFVRKNLCDQDASKVVAEESEEKKAQLQEGSKIYVRSHESLTSTVVTTDVNQLPSESSTPDCVIVSSEIIQEAPTNKIFIRNIETLTNPQAQDNTFFDPELPATTSFLPADTSYVNTFAPSIYVRSYDSLVNDTSAENDQQRCKISIKNMNTLIEPTLMHPPLINGIFGQAQNLVIHMRPMQAHDESLISFRDTSVTPETLPTSSNVSTCGGTDNDVIILDDSEINDASFISEFSEGNIISNNDESMIESVDKIVEEVIAENTENVENPERNQTPNDKPKIDIVNTSESSENQPMTRIPLDITNDTAPLSPPKKKKKMKIVKIIRVRKKNGKVNESESVEINTLDAVEVVFKCNIGNCSLHFSNAKILSYHKRCHSSDQITCPECNSVEFKNFNTLHTHLWRQHAIDMDLYSCKLCNFKTPFLSRLKNFHQKIHSNEKNYRCEYANCNKRFKNSKQLKNHAQIHKAVKLRKMQSNAVESDAKKIKCTICNKSFSSESGLYIHFMEHKNEEKRFNCEEKGCEYSTNDHNSFRRHKFQHTKAHQYSCPACDYTSIQSNTYRKHLEKNHKDLAESLLFKCCSCKFITISKSKYDGHVAKHMAENKNDL